MAASSRPAPISPADGDTVGQNSNRLVWHGLPGAVRYVLEMTTCGMSGCDTTRDTLPLAFDTTYAFAFFPSTDSAR